MILTSNSITSQIQLANATLGTKLEFKNIFHNYLQNDSFLHTHKHHKSSQNMQYISCQKQISCGLYEFTYPV